VYDCFDDRHHQVKVAPAARRHRASCRECGHH
jgi:hypothetical protein